MLNLIVTSSVNKDDLSGGLWDNLEVGAGFPTKIPADHPRLFLVLEFFDALFPQLVDAVLAVEPGIQRNGNPADLILRTADGPISNVVDATQAIVFPDTAKVDIFEYLYGKKPMVPLLNFKDWYAVAHPPTPPKPTTGFPIVGQQMDDMTEIFGAPTFAFAVETSGYKRGDQVTEAGKTYVVQTLGHPMGLRKFLVLKS